MKLDAAPTSLSGKKCLVTGANGGIGSSTIEHFQALGAAVFATDIGESFIGNDNVEYRRFDLLEQAQLDSCANWVSELAPDVLFNNAALFDMGSVLDADLDQHDRLFGLKRARALRHSKSSGSGDGQSRQDRIDHQYGKPGGASGRGACRALLRYEGCRHQLHAIGGSCARAAWHQGQRHFSRRH